MISALLYFSILAAVASLGYGAFLIAKVLKKSQGEGKQVEIAQAIQQGANAFLSREYKTIAMVALVLFVVLLIVFGQMTAWAFLVGAVSSALAGYIGMSVAVRANVRTTEAAKTGLAEAFDVAFKGGAVTGFLVAGLGLSAVY
ncbi:MAG: sodium/proton-translocating pyrophosphatase, partial [Patescibacteria group bacterium]